MDYAAIGGIAKCVADGRNVGAAPLTDPVVLRDLFRNIVAENGELASEVVVNSSDLFLQIRGRVVATDKRGMSVGINGITLREYSCAEQSRGVRSDHAGRNLVAGERRSLHDSCGSSATRAIGKENARCNLCGSRNIDHRGVGAEVTAI